MRARSAGLVALVLVGCAEEHAIAPRRASGPSIAAASSAFVPSPPARVRPPGVAGSWYPRSAEALAELVDGMLDAAPDARLRGGPVRALVVPHAGYDFSGATAAAAFRLVRGQARRRVIVLGPAHRGGFRGAAIDDFTHYRTPLGDIPVDTEAVARLRAAPLFGEQPGAGTYEHSIEMELPLLQRALRPGWRLVPILIGDIGPSEARALAEALRPIADEGTLVVASGDFTHYGPGYGFTPFPRNAELPARLEKLDKGLYDRIADLDPEGIAAYEQRTHIDACGLHDFMVLAALLSPDAHGTLVRYETSGKRGGDSPDSVSYVAAAFAGPRAPLDAAAALPRPDMKTLLALAIRALERGVRKSEADPDALRADLPIGERLQVDAATFVTLRKREDLRGCIGNLTAREPVWRSVVSNAVSAALRDDRFEPVRPAELRELTVEVSVLSPMRPIGGPGEIRLGADGVVLEKAAFSAVFLPDVATEQGWSLETMLTELSRKAGMAADGWRSGARYRVFSAQTFEGRVP